MRHNETIQLLKALQTNKSDTAATLEEALSTLDDLNTYLEIYALQMDSNDTIAMLDEMSIDILDDLVGKYLKAPSNAVKADIMTFLRFLLTEDPAHKIDNTLNKIWKSVFDPAFLGEFASETTSFHLSAYANTQPPGTVNFQKILEDNLRTGVLVFTEAEATDFFKHSAQDDGARNIQKRKRLFDTTPDKSPKIQINPISPYSTCLQASLEELKTQTHTKNRDL